LNRSGYAFVNFRHAEDAHRFRHQLHLSRLKIPEGEIEGQAMPLSIAFAKVQGFADNYTRFQHLLDGSAPTRCKPFFASDAVASLSEEDVQAAVRAASAAKAASVTHAGTASAVRHDGQATTLVVRNLPFSVDTQVDAMKWLGEAGFPQEQYNFFLFLPAKRKARAQGTACSPQTFAAQAQGGLGYCFVNFKKAQHANACLEALGGRSLQPGDPTLSVVSAKVQGISKCLSHFSSLAESGGRCTPWIDTTSVGTPCINGTTLSATASETQAAATSLLGADANTWGNRYQ